MPHDAAPRPDQPAAFESLPASVGILGAGRAGTALARAIARIRVLHPGTAAPRVVLAATRSPAAVRRHLAIHAPDAEAAHPGDLATDTELTVVAVPREELDEVDPAWLAGPRTLAVVDMTNTWGDELVPDWLAAAAAPGLPTMPGSAAIAAHWAEAGLTAPVVRAFSEVSHHELDRDGRAQPPLRALGVGADSPGPARAAVAALVTAMGFEPVEYAPLGRAAALEPGTSAFTRPLPADELARELA